MKENKLINFNKALKRLNETNTLYKSDKKNAIYRDALIQRYEFTFELAWKTLKQTMEDNSFLSNSINSPRNIIHKAYIEKFIDNQDIWLDMLNTRNNIAHTYNEHYAIEIATDISVTYIKKLSQLSKVLQDF